MNTIDRHFPGKKAIPLHRFLARLVWLCMLPGLCLAVFLALAHVQNLRDRQEKEAADQARNIATALDHNLGARLAALRMLAASPLVHDQHRLRDFYQEAMGFREHFGGHVVLADTSLQMLLNTRVPFGSLLPKLPRPKGHAAAPAVLATGRPAVGDTFFGPIAKKPLVALAAPVTVDGRTVAVLLGILETEHFRQRLAQLVLPAGWSVTLLDGKEDVIAGSAPSSAATGADASASPYRFIEKLAVAPWSVRVEIPHHIFQSRIMVNAGLLAAAILGFTLISIVAGRLAGNRLTGAMTSLADGSRPRQPSPVIAEIEAVRALLADETSAREETAQTLRDSEQRYADLFENAPDMYLIVSPDSGRIANCNGTLTTCTGFGKAELAGREIFTICHPESRARAEAVWEELNKTGLLHDVELQVVRSDGTILDVSQSATAGRDEGGNILDYRIVWRDIGERKRIEQELAGSRELLQAIVDGTPALIYVKDLEGRLLLVNQAFEAKFPLPRRELLGKTSHDLLPRELADAHRANDLAAMEKRAAISLEEQNDEPDGRHTYLTVKFPLFGPENTMYAVCGISTDITQRRRAEKDLAATVQLLEEIMASLDEAVLVVESNTRKILRCNRKAETMFGYAREELLGKSTEFLHVDADSCAEFSRRLLAELEKADHFSFEFRLRRHDGEIFPTEHYGRPLLAPHGFHSVVSVIRDLSGRKRIEGELEAHRTHLETMVAERTRALDEARRALLNLVEDINMKSAALTAANEKLQELDRLKSMFIASMSHELRTPLNSIIGFSSILKEEWLGPVTPEQKENLAAILLSGRHLLALINDVIDLSKIEAGMLGSEIGPFLLQEVVTEAVRAVENEAAAKGLAIFVETAPLEMRADRRRLLQCLLNLLGNAVKFTAAGEIRVTALALDQYAVVTVRDTGIGIRAQDMDKLFKPFSRLHGPGDSAYPGTGLGLYLTARLVREVLKGEIGLASEFGAGSAFTIKIPLITPENRDSIET